MPPPVKKKSQVAANREQEKMIAEMHETLWNDAQKRHQTMKNFFFM